MSRQTVQKHMTLSPQVVSSGHTLAQAHQVMRERNIRHLPVYDGEKLLGLISVRDVLREVVEVQRSMISQLEHYITGGGR